MAVTVDEARRALVDPTARLVGFLRELARKGQRHVTDVAEYELVRWLVDLRGPEIDIDLDLDAGPGDVVFSIDPIVSEPAPAPTGSIARWLPAGEVNDSEGGCPELSEEMPPEECTDEVLDAYEAWADRWQVWAEANRLVRAKRGLFDQLAVVARTLEQQDDQYELVLGTGLLSVAGDVTVHHPLLTTPAELEVERATGRISLRVAANATTRVVDRQLLEGMEGFDGARADVIREGLRSGTCRPLADENKEVLTRWRELALDRARPYEHLWDRVERPDEVPDLRFAPILVFRRRDRTSLIDYFDRMLEALDGPGATAPLGLAQLLTALESDDRAAWLEAEGATQGDVVGTDPLFPLPANPEQRLIIERLTGDNGVVVQGPPGTGKTHTIANLLSALLAKGQRVLVTSEKAQALRVLRDKLPDEVQKLCVSLTDVGRGGSTELDRSVTALSDRYAQFSPTGHAQTVERLTDAREDAKRQASELKEQIRGLREAETYEWPAVAAGYQGKLSHIADVLRHEAPRGGWVPLPVPDSAPFEPPLALPEVVELRRLLATTTPGREARAHQVLPDPAKFPTEVEVRGLVAAESAAAATAHRVASDLSGRLTSLGTDDVVTLRSHMARAAEALHELGLDLVEEWPQTWYSNIVRDGVAGRDTASWASLRDVSTHALEARQRLAGLGLRTVTLPAFEPVGPGSVVGHLEAARQLRDHLAAGNQLRRRLRPAVQKQAVPLLESAFVDGVPISNVELLDIVIVHLDVERVVRALAQRWADAGVPMEGAHSTDRAVGLLVDRAMQLGAAFDVLAALTDAAGLLKRNCVLIPLRGREDWQALRDALDAVAARIEAEHATDAIERQAARLRVESGGATAPPELGGMASALAERDAEGYARALAALVAAAVEQVEQRRCDDLFGRLHDAHPVLADQLRATAGDEEWGSRLAVFPDAWAWARARTFFDAQRQEGRERLLASRLDDALDRLNRATAELAAEEAWGRCMERMTAEQEQALRVYQQNITEGARKGKWSPRFAAGAREAMSKARGAVPAWVMPLREVVETIPPTQNCFDVVIVDEASQSGIEALFLLWLAPRVIVVGDERQCAPVSAGRELQPVFDKLDDYLHDLPQYLRLAFTPKNNLFGVLSTRFPSPIRLREHFRCMPEIVGWSSSQFYRDAPLVPLRQFGAERLPPLRSTYVAGASTTGSSGTLTNRIEAESIVRQVMACINDPDYDGKTMGVVVLQGRGQARLIDDLLQAEVPQVERENRRLRVGVPPDFQGDERDVVFVSMVVADRRSAVASLDWRRRFNVAATRAKDQMWLFHSVTSDLLSQADLRRSLLAYMLDPPPPLGAAAIDDDLSWASDRRAPFDSVFEQHVYLMLRDRGFHVTPQVEVNGRRIDLVVTGAKGRLAVECDGDYWHSSHEARLADIDRQLELERAGWRFWRVRGSEFYLDPDTALAPLWEVLERRGIRPGDLKVDGDSREQVETSWQPIDLPDDDVVDDQGDQPDPDVDVWGFLAPAGNGRRLLRAEPSSDSGARAAIPRSSHRATASHGPSSGAPAAAEVRAWARSLNLPVGERGRISPAVAQAWNEAHPDRRYKAQPVLPA